MHKQNADFDILSQLFQSSEDAVAVCNPAGEIILYNAAAGRIYGPVSSAQLDDCPQMLGLYLSDGSRLLRTDELPMAHALKGVEVLGFEILLRRTCMPDRRVTVDAYPIQKNGTVMGAMARSRQL
jgi:PAS domain-containing protein